MNFVDKLEASGWLVMVRRFHEFHGRLGFSAQVLPWIRPLLAPGCAWLAAVSKNSTMRVPELVATVCIFIRKKFRDGLRKIPCVRAEKDLGEIFRTDAKCEAGKVVLGGWVTCNNTEPKDAAWFSWKCYQVKRPGFSGANNRRRLGQAPLRSFWLPWWRSRFQGGYICRAWSEITRPSLWRRYGQQSYGNVGPKKTQHETALDDNSHGLFGLF